MKLRLSTAATVFVCGVLGSVEAIVVPAIPWVIPRAFIAAVIPLAVTFLYTEEDVTPPAPAPATKTA